MRDAAPPLWRALYHPVQGVSRSTSARSRAEDQRVFDRMRVVARAGRRPAGTRRLVQPPGGRVRPPHFERRAPHAHGVRASSTRAQQRRPSPRRATSGWMARLLMCIWSSTPRTRRSPPTGRRGPDDEDLQTLRAVELRFVPGRVVGLLNEASSMAQRPPSRSRGTGQRLDARRDAFTSHRRRELRVRAPNVERLQRVRQVAASPCAAAAARRADRRRQQGQRRTRRRGRALTRASIADGRVTAPSPTKRLARPACAQRARWRGGGPTVRAAPSGPAIAPSEPACSTS